ncbi:MAG: Flp pilus assembly protein CpaB [Lentisphaeria bacterium]|nr:Flp pilus assembly protein CpaB [Lentisphaeria bacterium]
MKNYLVLGISVLAGVLSFFFITNKIDAERKRLEGSSQRVQVLAYKTNFSAGQYLPAPASSFTVVKLPKSTIDKYRLPVVPATKENLQNLKVPQLSSDVKRGQFVRWGDFSITQNKADNKFAVTIPKDSRGIHYRAISVNVDNTSSVSNLIKANDHVDIIATFRFPSQSGKGNLDIVTLTLLQNVFVLATGQNYPNSDSVGRRAKSYNTLTFAVNAKEAEMLTFAQQFGKLNFTLRNPDDVYYEKEIQSVDFKYLEKNIQSYLKEREKNTTQGNF